MSTATGQAGPEQPLDQDTGVRRAMLRFALVNVLVLALLVVAISVVGGMVARHIALDEGRERAGLLARDFVGEHVTAGVHEGDSAALQRFASRVEPRIDDGTILHLKVWSEDHRVLWSDETETIGLQYPMEAEDEVLFGTEDVHADLSDLDKAENAAERSRGDREALEVYAGARDATGQPVVVEAYFSTARIDAAAGSIRRGLLPVALGALLLLQLAVLPLALNLARRVHRSEAARSRATEHALRSSELERRRLAQDLHDGVVQDLAGLGFVLPGLERALPDTPAGEHAKESVRQIREIVTRDVAALRSMMVEVHPPDLARTGLGDAVHDLAAHTSARGVRVDVAVEDDLDLPVAQARIAYRVVREGLHNVLKHAHAERAEVRIDSTDQELRVAVRDDGRGLPDGRASLAEGHLGLHLLEETVVEHGGTLTLGCGVGEGDGSRPGCVLSASLPLVPA